MFLSLLNRLSPIARKPIFQFKTPQKQQQQRLLSHHFKKNAFNQQFTNTFKSKQLNTFSNLVDFVCKPSFLFKKPVVPYFCLLGLRSQSTETHKNSVNFEYQYHEIGGEMRTVIEQDRLQKKNEKQIADIERQEQYKQRVEEEFREKAKWCDTEMNKQLLNLKGLHLESLNEEELHSLAGLVGNANHRIAKELDKRRNDV